jgi:hypothetical protein
VYPVYDLVIGNLDGAREPSDPDQDWSPPQISDPVDNTKQHDEENKAVKSDGRKGADESGDAPVYNPADSDVAVPHHNDSGDDEPDHHVFLMNHGAVVETRAAKKRKKLGTSKLIVADGMEVDHEEFLEAQKSDPFITQLWQKAQNPDETSRSKYLFFINKKGYLRWKLRGDGNDESSKLVVPKSHRGSVIKMAHDGILS